MNNDLQKASMLKRITAGTFDLILLACLIVALALGLSSAIGYDGYYDDLLAGYEKYGQQYGFDLVNMTLTEYEALTEEERALYDEAFEAISADTEIQKTYSLLINMTLIIVSVPTLVGYLLLELLVPLLFGNGQTLGKKVFSIALVRTDGVKVTPFMMTVRTLLGKYTVETMIPVAVIVLWLFGANTLLFGLLLIGLILLTQVILLLFNRNHCFLHDMMACTVSVDMASQRIFESAQARTEYIKRVSAEQANKAEY